MARVVEYDGIEHEFPDEFSDQDVSRALKGYDTQQKIQNFKDKLSNLPSGFAEEGMKNIAGGVVGGLYKAGESLPTINQITHPMIKRLMFGDKAAEQPEQKFDPYTLMGTEDKPFYTPAGAVQLAGEMFTPTRAIPKGIGGKQALQTAVNTAKSLLGKDNPILAMQEKTLQEKMKLLKSPIEAATEENIAKKESLQEAKDEATRKINLANADKMEFKINEHKQKIEEAKQKAQELEQQYAELPPPPEEPEAFVEREIPKPEEKEFTHPGEAPVLNKEYAQDAENAYKAKLAAEDAHEAAIKHHENVSNLVEESDKNISDFLKGKQAHHIKVGEHVKNEFNKIDKQLKEDYGKFVEQNKNVPIQIPEAKISKKDIEKNPILESLMDLYPTAKDNILSKALTKYKDFRTERFKLKEQMKFTDSAVERQQIKKALDLTENLEKDARQSLLNGMGTENAKAFDKLNARYTDLFALRGNKVVKHARKYGKISGNMVEVLSGSGEGQELLRNIIKQDPEMVKHVLGQRYVKLNKSIHNPDELTQEWINELPQLQEHINSRNETEKLIKNSKRNIEQLGKRATKESQNYTRLSNRATRESKAHSERMSAYKESLSTYKKGVTEQTKAKKQYDSDIKNYEKEKLAYQASVKKYGEQSKEHTEKVNKLEKEIENNKKEISGYESEIDSMTKHMEEIRERKSEAKLSLKEKVSLEKEYKKTQDKLKETREAMEESATGIKKQIIRIKNLYKIGKKLVGY